MPLDDGMTLTQVAPETDRKFFTVEEANRALPYLTRVIDDVISVYSQIVELRRRLEDHSDADESVAQLERLYEQAMDRLGGLVDELHAVGVELKDFERGLVDFPALHEEREVLLCWHRGEDEVAFWHEVDAGFGGRQPVALLEA